MNLTDPIADMLTRVRNGNMAMHEKVDIPYSKLKLDIAKILKEEGYILNYKEITIGNHKNVRVYLKYTKDRERVIKGLKRISKPGRRVYAKMQEIPKVLGGLGIVIISTPKGIITDKVARKDNVGGEILCYVW